MQSSQSSNSPKPTDTPHRPLRERLYHPAAVWLLRILIGATFIMSGFVKGIDPWGSVIKISEYFTVWGWDVPRSLVTCAAFALGAYEFVWGFMVLLGCYRRAAVWLL